MRGRAEEFFEIDLALLLAVPGTQNELPDAYGDVDTQYLLKLFFLLFSRDAFLPQVWDTAERSFHAYALNEARLYEEKVSQDLGQRVFTDIFPRLSQALADRVLEAIATAEAGVAQQPWAAHLVEVGRPWLSPVVARIAHIRQTIRKTAQQHGWAVTDAQLDDRHIVRRALDGLGMLFQQGELERLALAAKNLAQVAKESSALDCSRRRSDRAR